MHEEILVHTGQHYDPELSEVFFEELSLPRPDYQLEIGGGSNTAQTGQMLAALEPLLGDIKPDLVLVYGDTNSTLAGALCAVQLGLPVAHVEAGMRSFDRSMPEESNRVLTDHLSSLLLCSTETAVNNLKAESVYGETVLVGDVMADVALTTEPRARANTQLLGQWGLSPGQYLLATIHRPATVDDPDNLTSLVEILLALPLPVVFPLHPRTCKELERSGQIGQLGRSEHVHLTDPLGYLDFATLLLHARTMLTDSGGVQKEAYLAGIPCITLRTTTEWTETLEAGWNVLVGIDKPTVLAALERQPPPERPQLYGDGSAGERVVSSISQFNT